MRTVAGIFLVLHGLVHLLYAGHSMQYFELTPGLQWPAGSWIFGPGTREVRLVAAASCIAACLLFIAAGIAVLAGAGWRKHILYAACAVSSLVFILLWDASFTRMHDKGWIGVLINVSLVLGGIFRLRFL
ncbi:MAG: hypothetical protein JW874_05100 [Spirochaetales bacterium]|nr:hypothetical protein [Spirochaetales bacterium]